MKLNLEKPKAKKLVSEKGPSKEKVKVSKKKNKQKDFTPELPQLDMIPIDEKEEFNHTKKSNMDNMDNKKWKTPENIPVDPVDLDDMTLKDLIHSPEESGEYDFLIKEFGTTNPEEIDSITADRLKSGDYEQVTVGDIDQDFTKIDLELISSDHNIDDLPVGNSRPKPKGSTGYGKPNSSKDEEVRHMNRGILGRIKNFFSRVNDQADNVAKDFGWDK
jgi:hypothetical protein